uniref:Uncharacterized protein n=1 Tax=Plectus sambesii TaxID=2011161 RepID=A0A914UH96_9BILA
MGAAASSSAHKSDTPSTPIEKAVSRSIDRELAKEKIEMANVFKILLLGGSESGKTTIFKQMRILHLDGFTRADKINYRYQIHSNAVDALNQLIEACQKFRIVHESSIQGYVRDFLKFRTQTNNDQNDFELRSDVADKMHRIWISGPIQMAYKRRWEFTLLDSAK